MSAHGTGCLGGKAARGSSCGSLQQTRLQRQEATFYPTYGNVKQRRQQQQQQQKVRRKQITAVKALAVHIQVSQQTNDGLGLWDAAGGTAATSAYSWGLNSGGELGLPLDFSTHYQLGRQIGAGAYGTVYEATEKATGDKLAVKVLPKQRGKLTREKTIAKIQHELEVLAALQDCQQVVCLEDIFEDSQWVYIVQELCQGGDMAEALKTHGACTESQAAAVIYEVLKVISTCHAEGFLHGDVKPANFMMRPELSNPWQAIDGGRLRTPWLMAIDFGCSQNAQRARAFMRRTGTPVYMAPEVFQRQYGMSADLWSLGMMMYELLACRLPFWDSMDECKSKTIDEVARSVVMDDVPLDYGPFQTMSKQGLALLTALTQREPRKRITAAAALEHPWFREQLGYSCRPGQACINNIVALDAPACSVFGPELAVEVAC